jgi:medium-chain acyl-[acyl-carrier-protein] hydrolase
MPRVNTTASPAAVDAARPRLWPATDPAEWFFVPRPRPAARLRLFCLPYAAGWPWAFRGWPAGLGEDIEVRAICLPGRGRRTDAAAASIDELVAGLCDAMGQLDLPYALYGHSFGALVAFELAAELERQGAPLARRVFVSGSTAPGTHTARAPLHELSDDELAVEMLALNTAPSPALADPSVLATTLALFRADLRLAEQHRFRAAALSSPLTAFFGEEDPSATAAEVARWRDFARGEFELRGFPGDHFFVHSQQDRLLEAIQQGLA